MPETISVVCSACNARMKAPAAAAGRRGTCANCRATFRIPAPLPPAADETAAAVALDDGTGPLAEWRSDEAPASEGPPSRQATVPEPVVHELGDATPSRPGVSRKTLLVLAGTGFGGMLLMAGVLVGVVTRPRERADSEVVAVAPRPAAMAPKAEPVSSVDEHEAVRKVVTTKLGDEHFIAVVHSVRMGKCSVTDRKGVTYEAEGVASASAENSKVPGLANDAELAKIHGEWRIIRVSGRNPR